jgi:hypothetical protein
MAIGRQHEAKFMVGIWKQIEVSNMEEDMVWGWSQDNELKEKMDALRSFSTGLHAEAKMRNIEVVELCWW